MKLNTLKAGLVGLVAAASMSAGTLFSPAQATAAEPRPPHESITNVIYSLTGPYSSDEMRVYNLQSNYLFSVNSPTELTKVLIEDTGIPYGIGGRVDGYLSKRVPGSPSPVLSEISVIVKPNAGSQRLSFDMPAMLEPGENYDLILFVAGNSQADSSTGTRVAIIPRLHSVNKQPNTNKIISVTHVSTYAYQAGKEPVNFISDFGRALPVSLLLGN